tara:strand:+ start:6338 stop:6523 length:186 start_codon:yes stop_codon:yes gene_type:complete
MIVKFIKDYKLHKDVKLTKAGSQMQLKESLAKKLWLKDAIEILQPHDFVKPVTKKETKKED